MPLPYVIFLSLMCSCCFLATTKYFSSGNIMKGVSSNHLLLDINLISAYLILVLSVNVITVEASQPAPQPLQSTTS